MVYNLNLFCIVIVVDPYVLKMALYYPKGNISFLNFHEQTTRGTQELMCLYKLALKLFKPYNV
jgi:hypothetical protein